jgi:HAE1 family hydrophobic/amphiphilic exporter-1
MRTSKFIDDTTKRSKLGKYVDNLFEKQVLLYEKALDYTLNNRWKVLIFSFLFFAGTFVLVKWIPKEFVPAQDISSFMIRLKTADGSSLSFTDEATKEVEAYFNSRKEIKRFYVSIGGFGGQGGSESNISNMFVTLHRPKDRPKDKLLGRSKKQFELLQEYRDYFKKNFKKGMVFVQDTSQGGFSASGRGFPVEFTLMGGNWVTLIKAAKDTIKEMKDSGIYTDVDTDYKESVLEIKIFPDRDRAKLYGVSVQEIGTTINALIGGVVVGKYSKDGHRNDIRVKMINASKDSLEDLKKIFVRNTRGELIKLLDVVVVKELPGVQTISRRQRQRAITIFAGIGPGKSQGEALDEVKIIAKKHLPPGYALVESGSSESFKETFKSLLVALALGILIAYMILGAQFNSFIDPVTVLMALPFSFSGAFLGLWLTGQTINMYSMIGLILLMGIVKKNSILLVDFTNQRREDGLSVQDALKDACPKRLRPILMTTFSTVAGAIPLALSLGPGSESLKPMAIAIIGGSIVSTVLTLVVVPAMYSLFANKKGHNKIV